MDYHNTTIPEPGNRGESAARQVVATVPSEIEGLIIAKALERAGIRCWLSGATLGDQAQLLPKDFAIAVEPSDTSAAQDIMRRVEATRRPGPSGETSHHGLWGNVREATGISALRFAVLISRKLRTMAALPRFRVAGILWLQFVVALGLFAWVGQREIVEIVMAFVVTILILTTVVSAAVWIVLDPSRARHRMRQYSPLFVALGTLVMVLRLLSLAVS